jgi:hypothetical protein
MTRTRATAAPPFGLRPQAPRQQPAAPSPQHQARSTTTTTRREVEPLQAIAPGPAQAIVFRLASQVRVLPPACAAHRRLSEEFPGNVHRAPRPTLTRADLRRFGCRRSCVFVSSMSSPDSQKRTPRDRATALTQAALTSGARLTPPRRPKRARAGDQVRRSRSRGCGSERVPGRLLSGSTKSERVRGRQPRRLLPGVRSDAGRPGARPQLGPRQGLRVDACRSGPCVPSGWCRRSDMT